MHYAHYLKSVTIFDRHLRLLFPVFATYCAIHCRSCIVPRQILKRYIDAIILKTLPAVHLECSPSGRLLFFFRPKNKSFSPQLLLLPNQIHYLPDLPGIDPSLLIESVLPRGWMEVHWLEFDFRQQVWGDSYEVRGAALCV